MPVGICDQLDGKSWAPDCAGSTSLLVPVCDGFLNLGDPHVNTALWVLFYVIETLPIFVIARKCEDANAWMAFVPVANLWLLCNMADFEAGFLLV